MFFFQDFFFLSSTALNALVCAVLYDVLCYRVSSNDALITIVVRTGESKRATRAGIRPAVAVINPFVMEYCCLCAPMAARLGLQAVRARRWCCFCSRYRVQGGEGYKVVQGSKANEEEEEEAAERF